MRLRFGLVITVSLILAQAPATIPQAQPVPSAVNPHAAPEARALLQFIGSISGQYTLTGQHNFPNDGSRWTDRVYDITAKYPALFGEDFGFSAGDDKDSTESRPAMIAEVKRQYENGAVIALTWHAVKPTEDEPVTFRDSVQGHLSDFEWRELLTSGTTLNLRWQAQVDVIAGYLRQLRDAHVPVLFRPYHEMNGNWFWWGGRPGPNGSAALYRQIWDRFVNVHHLDNLVWVWNVNSPGGNAGPIADYYPGAQFADILTIDIYGEFKAEYHTDMLTLAAGKPIALGEVGAVPTAEILATQPRWAYFMVWSGGGINFPNSVDALNTIYHAPRLLTRDNPAFAEPMAAIRKATADRTAGKLEAQPVTPGATAAAKDLLARMYNTKGGLILGGPEVIQQSPGSGGVIGFTGKRDSIYSDDLAVTKEMGKDPAKARRDIEEEAKIVFQKGVVINLLWHPTRPSDDEPAPAATSLHGQLTDFEWNELLTPGTDLNKRWIAQVDEIAVTLKHLQEAGIPVLWQPCPEPNSKSFWWSGRKGIRGFSALYRQIFDRLVDHDGLHNLIWVWDAAPPSFGPNSSNSNGILSDFFPGLLYVDVLAFEVDGENPKTIQTRADSMLSQLGVGKVVGIQFNGAFPPPDLNLLRRWAQFGVPGFASRPPK
jgi:mannan endo-1,4-beta-mannosidase